MGEPRNVLYIVEGFATGASIHAATGEAVAVAFNAGNLIPVAQALREKFPDLKLVLCADDDHRTPGNPGLTKATEAAIAVNGWLAMPEFGESRTLEATDFNDLHQALGLEAVRQSLNHARQPVSDVSGWPDPKPTEAPLHPVPVFDPEVLLPEALRGWIMDEADLTVFLALKEAIDGRIKAAAKDSKKGSLDAIAWELQDHRQQRPELPILRRYKSNDTTVEKLGELLRENPAGLLVLRDELVGLIASWDREGREGERAFYLEAWNGNASFDTDRFGRGSIFIPNLCVSLFGGIQPDKLVGYLEQASNALANDGMLQRFQLLVYPDHRAWEWRDRIPDKAARDRAFAVFEALAPFEPEHWGAAPADEFAKFPYFRFDEAAQDIFIEWSGDLHRTRIPAEDNPIISQHLSKFDKLFPALALILHLVACAATGPSHTVTAESALRAAAWCDDLEAHARRCYGLLADDGLRSAQALAEKIRQGKLADGFTARDVRRNQWRSLTTEEAGTTSAAKIPDWASRPTANTAERSLMAVTAVPQPDQFGNSRPSNGSNGGTPLAGLAEIGLPTPLTLKEYVDVNRWLDRINESDPDTVEMVLEQCRTDPEAKAYFLNRARETQGDW